jgi:hypothetical protein
VYGILGLYASIGVLVKLRASSSASAAAANTPAPEKPDYTTVVHVVAEGIPSAETDPAGFEAFMNGPPENAEKWASGGSE